MCKALAHITVIITSLWYSSVNSQKKAECGTQHPDFGLEFVFSGELHFQRDELFFFFFATSL